MTAWSLELHRKLGRQVWPHIAVDAFYRRNAELADHVDLPQYLTEIGAVLRDGVASRAVSSIWAANALTAVVFELTEGDKGDTVSRVKAFLSAVGTDGPGASVIAGDFEKYGIKVRPEDLMPSGEDRRTRDVDLQLSVGGADVESASADRAAAETVATVTFMGPRANREIRTCSVICALEEEAHAFDRYFPGIELEGTPPKREGFVGDLRVVNRVIGGMGNVFSAIALRDAIEEDGAEAVLLAGISGGIEEARPGFRRGDVVVPPSIVGYEWAKLTPAATLRRLLVLRASGRLMEVASRVDRAAWAARIGLPRPDGEAAGATQLHFDDILSGDKVVANRVAVEQLQSLWPAAIAIEMESFGLALAALKARTEPEVLIVKGISDWADDNKADDEWRPYAGAASAAFCWSILGDLAKVPASGRVPRRKSLSGDNFDAKNQFVRRLAESWIFVANVLKIPHDDQRAIRQSVGHQGLEGQGLWEYLADRDRLDELPGALLHEDVDRPDLAAILWNLSS